MSETYNIPRDTTLARIAAALEGNIAETLDGTVATYKKVMREWFLIRGAEDASPAELTALCDEWYRTTRPEWTGWVEFYQPDVSSVSTGTKMGDNEGMTCEPSTDTVEGQDDYAGNPLFACVDVNFVVDQETLKPQITAIDGVTSNFRRYDLDTYVGVMQMSGYMFWRDDADTYIRGYSANRNVPYNNITPLPSALNPDGTVREWVVHAKYVSHTNNGKLSSCSGQIPTGFVSHNTAHTLSNGNGTQYSGYTTADDTFMQIMYMIKYASLTMDGIIQGCCNMNYQYIAQVSEGNVKRIILTTANGANLEVGMSCLLGNYAGNTDRGQAAMYSITGQAGAKITAIEPITVDGVDYTAVYVDTDSTFETVSNDDAEDGEGMTYLSTFHWPTGTTDNVLGNDGSMTSNTSGKYPGKIQGVEFMNGCYEVIADAILQMEIDSDGVCWYQPWIVKSTIDQGSTIDSEYQAVDLKCIDEVTSASWQYIKKKGFDNGVFFPIEIGGSSSTYHRDGFYEAVPATQIREWLLRGSLTISVSSAGLSALHGANAVSNGNWHCASRLSAAGNRGEWAA